MVMVDQTGAVMSGFQIAAVVRRGVSVYFRNFVPLLPVGIVATLPSIAGMFLISAGSGIVYGSIFYTILDFIGFCWLSAGVTYSVVSDLRGNRASAGEIFARSLAALPRLIWFFLVVTLFALVVSLLTLFPLLGVFVALALFIWLYVIYWVALPTVVVEKSGPIAALGRSSALTRGHRWKVLGIILVWGVASYVVAMIVELLFFLASGQLHSSAFDFAIAPVSTVILGLGASIAAVGYHDLRVVKEGVGTEEIARVFD